LVRLSLDILLEAGTWRYYIIISNSGSLTPLLDILLEAGTWRYYIIIRNSGSFTPFLDILLEAGTWRYYIIIRNSGSFTPFLDILLEAGTWRYYIIQNWSSTLFYEWQYARQKSTIKFTLIGCAWSEKYFFSCTIFYIRQRGKFFCTVYTDLNFKVHPELKTLELDTPISRSVN